MEPGDGQRSGAAAAAELRLRYLAGPLRGQELHFHGPQVRIGRSRDNELVLPDQQPPASSGHHAEARFESGGWWLIDLDSTNGTQVNGRAVDRHRLRAGDRIAFGGGALLLCVATRRRRQRAAAAGIAAALLLLIGTVFWQLRRLGGGFEPVAESAAASVYLIVVEQTGRRQAIATAFAVEPSGVLATNAHVVIELRRRGALPAGGALRALAVRGDSGGRGRALRGARVHPSYRSGTLRNDVALLYLAPGPPLAPLPLANAGELAALRRGVRLAALGFPQDSTDAGRPRARLSEDVLGDLRGGRYLGVGLGIVPGTSGSPILLQSGKVIGLVAGGNFILDPDQAGRVAAGGSMNWGVSVAALRELLALP